MFYLREKRKKQVYQVIKLNLQEAETMERGIDRY
jgi:hypothetical protein